MATRRSLNRSISISEQVNELSLKAALLFTWMIPHADDFGILPGSPRKIKALVVPMRDDISAEDVEAALLDMAESGLIYLYEVDGEKLLQFCKWEQHQTGLHKRTKSRFPTYNEAVNQAGDQETSFPNASDPPVSNVHIFPGISRNFPESTGNSGSTEENRREENRREYILSSQSELATPENPDKNQKEDQPGKRKLQPVYAQDSVEYSLATQMRSQILQNLPTAKVPKPTPEKMQRWCHDINLMTRLDGRDPEQIEQVMNFALTDPFWMSNILSPGKLRKQYDTLVLQMNRKGGHHDNGRDSPISRQKDDIEQFVIT